MMDGDFDARVRELWADGWSRREIARRMPAPYQRVCRALNRDGVRASATDRSRRGMPAYEWFVQNGYVKEEKESPSTPKES